MFRSDSTGIKGTRALLALALLFMAAVSLMFGPMAGTSFAYAVPPVAPPPVSTIPSLAEITTGAGVDTGVAIAGADAAAGTSAIAAGATCAAVTLGTCAVAAVAVAGAAYGVYSLLHLSWGAHHVTAPSGDPVTGQSTCTGGDGVSWPIFYWINSTYLTTTGTPGCGSYAAGVHQWGASGGTGNTTASYSLDHVYQYADGHVVIGGERCSGGGWVFSPGGIGGAYTSATNLTYTNPANVITESWIVNGGCNGSTDIPNWPTLPSGKSVVAHLKQGTPSSPAQHTVHVHQECLSSAGTLASTKDLYSPTFDDSMGSVPDVSMQACPSGQVPGRTTVTETTQGSPTETPLYDIPKPKLDPTNPCSTSGAGCRPTVTEPSPTTNPDGSPKLNPIPLPIPWGNLPPDPQCEWAKVDSTGSSLLIDGGPLSMADCNAADPNPTQNPQPGPKAPGADGSACFPTGWGVFNPIEWVYKPVKCVLIWAFEPTNAQVEADSQVVSNAWNNSPPGVMWASAHKLINPIVNMPTGDGTTCDGPTVTVNVPDTTQVDPASHGLGISAKSMSMKPFSMCNQVGQWVHNWAMPLLTACLYVGTFFLCFRILTKTIGLESPFGAGVGTDVT